MRDDSELTAIEKAEVVEALTGALRSSESGYRSQLTIGSKQWAYDKLADALDRIGYEIRRR